jgi:hypothetical protein
MPSSQASIASGSHATHAQFPPPGSYRAAALLLWPRLEPEGLRRAGDDPVRLARLAERRTGIPLERIVAMLERAAAALPADAARPSRPRIAVPIRPDLPLAGSGVGGDAAPLARVIVESVA